MERQIMHVATGMTIRYQDREYKVLGSHTSRGVTTLTVRCGQRPVERIFFAATTTVEIVWR